MGKLHLLLGEAGHDQGPGCAPVSVQLHKHMLSDALTLRNCYLALLQHSLYTVAQLSGTADVACTYLVLHLPGLHVNISI